MGGEAERLYRAFVTSWKKAGCRTGCWHLGLHIHMQNGVEGKQAQRWDAGTMNLALPLTCHELWGYHVTSLTLSFLVCTMGMLVSALHISSVVANDLDGNCLKTSKVM